MARRDFKGLERRRMRAVRMFERGATQAEVHRALKVSRTTASRWGRMWEKEGARGLRAAGRAGRKPNLEAKQRREVERALRRGPRAYGYGTELWTLERVRDVIAQVTGVRYHRGHVWRILRQLGWSPQKPTTRARERDEAAIQRWVHETWPRVKKTPSGKTPRSSSSTKAGSPSGPRSGGRGHRAGKRRS
jgi:transposase